MKIIGLTAPATWQSHVEPHEESGFYFACPHDCLIHRIALTKPTVEAFTVTGVWIMNQDDTVAKHLYGKCSARRFQSNGPAVLISEPLKFDQVFVLSALNQTNKPQEFVGALLYRY